MSPELVVRHDFNPSIPAESWHLPTEVTGELTEAVLGGRITTVVTENVGLTDYGVSPMARRVTTRSGILTEVESGRLVMEVESGLVVTQVAGTPNVDTASLSEENKGRTEISVFREFTGWEEQTKGEERVDVAEKDDTVTSTEYIASIAVEGGQKFNFYPPPPHLTFA